MVNFVPTTADMPSPTMPITSTTGDEMLARAKQDHEVRMTDPKTGGQKGVKDTRFDLIPPKALEEVAKVYGFGAKKYSDNNWAKGYSWRLSFGAMMRHAWAWFRGEDYDPETGLHHMAHVAWHTLTIMTFQMEKLGTDDRLHNFIEDQKAIQNGEVR